MCMSNKRKNLIFILAVFLLWGLLILFGVKANNPDNDMYFLGSTGRYILDYGVPSENPFCIDEGLKIIVQQWFGSIIDYVVLSNYGATGIFLLACLYMVMETFTMGLFISNYTKSRQVLFSTLVISSVSQLVFFNTRGSIITSCILLMEVFFLTRYERTGKYSYLLYLPLASVLLSNWQSSLWAMLFVYVLPFLVPDRVTVLRTGVLRHYKEQRRYYVPLLVSMVLMAPCGLLNPYGLDGIAYTFLSGASLNGHVQEISAPPAGTYHLLATVVSFASVFVYMTRKKEECDVRMLCLCFGSMVLSCTMRRNVWYGIFALPPFALLMNEFVNMENWKSFTERLRPPSKISYGFLIGYMTAALAFILWLSSAAVSYSGCSGQYDNGYTPLSATEYLAAYDKKEVTVLPSFNNGGFFEWYGYKVYLDSRPEIYNSNINGKKDIYNTYLSIYDGKADYDSILKEYQFSHIFADYGSSLYYYMESREDYFPVIEKEAEVGYQLYEREGFTK